MRFLELSASSEPQHNTLQSTSQGDSKTKQTPERPSRDNRRRLNEKSSIGLARDGGPSGHQNHKKYGREQKRAQAQVLGKKTKTTKTS